MSIAIQTQFSNTNGEALSTSTMPSEKKVTAFREQFPPVPPAPLQRTSSSMMYLIWMGFVTFVVMTGCLILPFLFNVNLDNINEILVSTATYAFLSSWIISRVFKNRTLNVLRFFTGLAGLGNVYFAVLIVLLGEFYLNIEVGTSNIFYLGVVLSVVMNIWLSNRFLEKMLFCPRTGIALHKGRPINVPLHQIQSCLKACRTNNLTELKALHNNTLKTPNNHVAVQVYESQYTSTRLIEAFIHCESTLEKCLRTLDVPSKHTWRFFSQTFDCTEENLATLSNHSPLSIEKELTLIAEKPTVEIHEAIVEYARDTSVPLVNIGLLLVYTGLVAIFQFMMTALTYFVMPPSPSLIFTMMMGPTYYLISNAYVDFAKRLNIRQPVFVGMMIPFSSLLNIGLYSLDLSTNVLVVVVFACSLLAMHRTSRILKQQFYCSETNHRLELMTSRSFHFEHLKTVEDMIETLDFHWMKGIRSFEPGHPSKYKCNLDIYGSPKSPTVQIQIRITRRLYDELHDQCDDFFKPKTVIIHSSTHVLKQSVE